MFEKNSGRTLNLPGKRRLYWGRTLVMGIINVTDDSFHSASRVADAKSALERALEMAAEGADILDIGAESTRPGSGGMSAADERKAVLPAIKAIRSALPDMPLSVDTRKAEIAEAAFGEGADIINDVSGLELTDETPDMLRFLASSQVAYVLTHTRGTPDTMQIDPKYDCFLDELDRFFQKKISLLTQAGVASERIILDPGIGFGKRYEDNLAVLANLQRIRKHGYPLLIGASRKGFIGKALGVAGVENRLEGTLAITSLCAWQQVDIVRVHDVLENKRVVQMLQAVRSAHHA